MSDVKVDYRVVVASALNEFIKTKNIEASQVDAETIAVQTPPNPEMGDLGVPLFVFAIQWWLRAFDRQPSDGCTPALSDSIFVLLLLQKCWWVLCAPRHHHFGQLLYW